ncbi:hypothetical protein HOLleu_07664 [Holothuria leucospilota]|uniref:Uncharacterized protein n=1 Tax=Holothuria leucospilota TaxID=206669 RepID=A0A9Q1CGB6_HOLLE|nr:hypothetical protein HOLleu_07664 [Holothuria leucospilota]
MPPDGSLSHIMQTLNMSINMPKPDLQVFRGDPGDYYNFINNFEASVTIKLSDDRQKLTYLLQFYGGDAKYSIACCVTFRVLQG